MQTTSLRVCTHVGVCLLLLACATTGVCGHRQTTTIGTNFTPQALLLSGANNPGDIPAGFRRAVPVRGLALESARRPTKIFGAVIGAKLFGPAYSSKPAAWFYGADTTGSIVPRRPAIGLSFRLFMVGDGDDATNGAVTVRFLLGKRVVSTLTISEDRVVVNAQNTQAQAVTFTSKLPFTSVVISTNDAVTMATIDDLMIQIIGR